MEALIGLLVVVGAALVVPVLLLKLLFGVVWLVIALPLRILGALLHLAFALAGGLAKALGTMLATLALLFGLFLLVVALPLLPLLVLAGGAWLLARAFRPRSVAT
jgi:hypothetical protein